MALKVGVALSCIGFVAGIYLLFSARSRLQEKSLEVVSENAIESHAIPEKSFDREGMIDRQVQPIQVPLESSNAIIMPRPEEQGAAKAQSIKSQKNPENERLQRMRPSEYNSSNPEQSLKASIAAIKDIRMPGSLKQLLGTIRDKNQPTILRWRAMEQFKEIQPQIAQEELEKLTPGDPLKRRYRSLKALEDSRKNANTHR